MRETLRGIDTAKRETLTAIIGPMFSGKTGKMIDMYDEIARFVAESSTQEYPPLFKPAIDNRYGVPYVASHDEVRRLGVVCTDSSDIVKYLNDNRPTHIFIDEAQFFDDGLVDLIDDILDSQIGITFTALNQNYLGEPFHFTNPNGQHSDRHIGELISRADKIYLLTADCTICGEPATKTQRLIDLDHEVMVGGGNIYEPRCIKHHSPATRL